LLYSALDASNVVAWLASCGGRKPTLVWGIRGSHEQQLNWRRRLPHALSRRLSPTVDLLISNSQAGLNDHRAEGFRARDAVVIPNGIDVDAFRPDAAPSAGARLRAEWGVPPGVPLVGVVGRLAPMKDHPTFLRAAAALARTNPGLRFACVGDGPADYCAALERGAAGLGLAGSVVWAGNRTDMPAVYNALDLACCCSRDGEGFANVVAEAMACAVPCVATGVGDAARIVGPTGRVVPPADPVALAEGIGALLALDPAARARLGKEARARIVDRYSVETLAAQTEAELDRLVRGA
jgi:glycosyltransferase involved in cell wall biosynthesis